MAEHFRLNELLLNLYTPQVEIHKQRELCRVKRENGLYGGYRRDILKENLTEREEQLLICETCKGIMREARILSSGEQVCSCCNRHPKKSRKVASREIMKMISSLKGSCPLMSRGCDWIGTLNDCEDHLETCGYVYGQCLGCEEVIQRKKLKVHEIEDCPQRIVECEHCRKDFKSCRLPKHLDECPEVEVHQQRNLCRVERMNGLYGGYKKDILRENLTEREKLLLICEICKGIMKEASISSKGVQVCSSCEVRSFFSSSKQAPNLSLRKMISSLKCCCPLINRGCDWLGTLNDCENHLATCGYVKDKCKLGCREVLQRNKLKVHEIEDCPQRKVECEHCHNKFKFCELTTHLDECPKMEVSCKLKCGKKLCRENMAQHLEQECGLVVETCKLGCGVELTRDELKIHVTDTCVQRIIPCKHCGEDFKYCDMTNHLDVCPRMKVSCELGCDIMICREDMTQHIEVDCVEKEIECPFVKYKCEVGLIKRKYLSQHLKEKETKHLGLKLTETELKLTETELKLTTMKLKLTGEGTIINDLRLTVEKRSRRIQEQSQDIYDIKTLVCLFVCLFVWLFVLFIICK